MNGDPNHGMELIKDSLRAHLPHRYVQRGLVDPADAPREQLQAGLICVVSQGGGLFANYLGREGDLGRMKVALLCFVQVDEDTKPVAVEEAEFSLLNDLLGWTRYPNGLGEALPQEWRQSEQLEHPFGWLMLGLDVRF